MVEERRQLRAALDFRARTPLAVIRDDALAALPGLFAALPDPICLLATHCLYQWPEAARKALDAELRCASTGRSIYRVTIDHPAAIDSSRPQVFTNSVGDEAPIEHEAALTVFRDGATETTLLGRYDSWGRRGIWLT
jgi:hypothetical protein